MVFCDYWSVLVLCACERRHPGRYTRPLNVTHTRTRAPAPCRALSRPRAPREARARARAVCRALPGGVGRGGAGRGGGRGADERWRKLQSRNKRNTHRTRAVTLDSLATLHADYTVPKPRDWVYCIWAYSPHFSASASAAVELSSAGLSSAGESSILLNHGTLGAVGRPALSLSL